MKEVAWVHVPWAKATAGENSWVWVVLCFWFFWSSLLKLIMKIWYEINGAFWFWSFVPVAWNKYFEKVSSIKHHLPVVQGKWWHNYSSYKNLIQFCVWVQFSDVEDKRFLIVLICRSVAFGVCWAFVIFFITASFTFKTYSYFEMPTDLYSTRESDFVLSVYNQI